MSILRNGALCMLALLPLRGQAATDPVLEQRVTHVAQQLRCLVCQNQTIADSQAQLALELKAAAREQLVQGRSEQDVIDFMVARYGDFVLYRPPVKASTWLLWFGPFVLLAAALLLLLRALRGQTVPPPLTRSALERAAALLADSPKSKESA